MLLTIIVILLFGTLILSGKEIYFAFNIARKKKPINAKECYFCKIEIHEETKATKTLHCLHPIGKYLPELDNPLECPSECKYGLLKDDNLPYEKAINFSSFYNTLITETFRIIATLIPSILIIIEILGVKQ